MPTAARLSLLLFVCCCAGALERNLAPLVATDVVPDAKPRPVAVAVSGVAFPHPEKVSSQPSLGDDSSSSCV